MLFSPRTRGCSVFELGFGIKDSVFPAHAGMFRHGHNPRNPRRRFPRARGDVPHGIGPSLYMSMFSPRTRGCSWNAVAVEYFRAVFPAHAGMFLRLCRPVPRGLRFPRARGDVPGGDNNPAGNLPVFPAHAGMFRSHPNRQVRRYCFPRARGDVPTPRRGWSPRPRFSPRTRGCSSRPRNHHQHEGVFPAHAGMFRIRVGVCGHPNRFPRARGDVPRKHLMVARLRRFSPRTRGCSCPGRREIAHL